MAKKEPEIIDLLDTDDDSDDDNATYPPTAAAAAAAVVTAGTKRPRSEFSSATSTSSSSLSSKNVVHKAKIHDTNDRKSHTTCSRRLPGCMLHPTPSPIKLFATRQDEQLRETLPSANSLSQKHWSYEHCWTLREMMGLDRFSGLLTERFPVSTSSATTTPAPAASSNKNLTLKKNSGCGIDWCLITTYLLDVSDLLNDLKELPEVRDVVARGSKKDYLIHTRVDGFLSIISVLLFPFHRLV